MPHALLAGLGGFIGSALRYLINVFIYEWFNYPLFPYGTLAVNILGCLLIGFLAGLAEYRDAFSPDMRVFIFIGILGGFTTFSSFGYDTFGLWRSGEFLLAFANIALQVVIGLGAVWLGFVGAKFIFT